MVALSEWYVSSRPFEVIVSVQICTHRVFSPLSNASPESCCAVLFCAGLHIPVMVNSLNFVVRFLKALSFLYPVWMVRRGNKFAVLLSKMVRALQTKLT